MRHTLHRFAGPATLSAALLLAACSDQAPLVPDAAGNVYVASAAGNVFRKQGSAWTPLATGGPALRGIWGTSQDALIAVGESGSIFRGTR